MHSCLNLFNLRSHRMRDHTTDCIKIEADHVKMYLFVTFHSADIHCGSATHKCAGYLVSFTFVNDLFKRGGQEIIL